MRSQLIEFLTPQSSFLIPSQLLNASKHPSENVAVPGRDGGGEVVLDPLHRAGPRCGSVLAEPSDGGAHAAAVGWIVDALNESVGLEPVDELGHVGSHAALPRGELAEGERLL